MLRLGMLLLLTVACRESGTLQNFTAGELQSVAAKRGLEHFRSVTTNDISYTKWVRPLLELPISNLGGPTDHKRPWLTMTEAVNTNGYYALNCHICHSGWVGSTYVGGLPNKHFDMQQFDTVGKVLDWLGWVVGDGVTAASSRYYYTVMAAMAEKNSHTLGTNMGTWNVYATTAHLRPHAKSMDDWEIPSPGFAKVMEVSQGVFPIHHPRPWWLARYSRRHFWADLTPSGAAYSAADLALALGTPNYGNDLAYQWEDRFRISYDQQQYMAEISSPTYPAPVDTHQVTQGYKLYSKKCAGCHGTLTPTGLGTYDFTPTAKQPADYAQAVGTDTKYWEMQYKLSFAFTEHVHTNEEFNRDLGTLDVPDVKRRPRPYIVSAPPLVGVWASAPYLHNGSVPTLWDMLQPPHLRPVRYKLAKDKQAYDYVKVGVSYTKPEQDLTDKYIYDTTRDEAWGMSNKGHTFGTKLPASDKWALIEFLKTLATSNVIPSK